MIEIGVYPLMTAWAFWILNGVCVVLPLIDVLKGNT